MCVQGWFRHLHHLLLSFLVLQSCKRMLLVFECGFRGKNRGKQGATAFGPIENDIFSLFSFFFEKKKGGKDRCYVPEFSGKRRTNERTGIKSCSEGELVS